MKMPVEGGVVARDLTVRQPFFHRHYNSIPWDFRYSS